jgi:hypothetical protein
MNFRYGTGRGFARGDVMALLADGATEAARIVRPGGHVIVKCQDQADGSTIGDGQWQTFHVAAHAGTLGLVDVLHLLGLRARTVPSNTQRRARRNLSTFAVFRRPT